MKRPAGVTVLAISMFLGIPYLLTVTLALFGRVGFLGGSPIFLMSFVSMFVDWPAHAFLVFFLTVGFSSNPAVLASVYVLLMLVLLIIGAGLLRLQNWARLAVIVLAIVNLVVASIGFAGPRMLMFRQSYLSMAVEIAALIYLLRPEVKQVFGATRI